ncbi:MAG: hypothetical protein HY744_04900 [Deltaproteobacteria bacterium]|nr:hypothetical protein [Deltaproteobacteria bacterium]
MQPPTREQIEALIESKRAKGEDVLELEARLAEMLVGKRAARTPALRSSPAGRARAGKHRVSLGPEGVDDSGLLAEVRKELASRRP